MHYGICANCLSKGVVENIEHCRTISAVLGLNYDQSLQFLQRKESDNTFIMLVARNFISGNLFFAILGHVSEKRVLTLFSET